VRLGLWQALKALKHINQPTKRPLINQRSKSQLTAQPAIVPPTRKPRPPPNRSARVVITASAVQRGTKRVDLKAIVDRALLLAKGGGYADVRSVLVYEKSALPRCGGWCVGRMVRELVCGWLSKAVSRAAQQSKNPPALLKSPPPPPKPPTASQNQPPTNQPTNQPTHQPTNPPTHRPIKRSKGGDPLDPPPRPVVAQRDPAAPRVLLTRVDGCGWVGVGVGFTRCD